MRTPAKLGAWGVAEGEAWRTVAEVRLDAVASGVSAQVSYDFDYVVERILAVGEGEIGRAAVACGYPVRLEPHVRSHWPRFLDDLEHLRLGLLDTRARLRGWGLLP